MTRGSLRHEGAQTTILVICVFCHKCTKSNLESCQMYWCVAQTTSVVIHHTKNGDNKQQTMRIIYHAAKYYG